MKRRIILSLLYFVGILTTIAQPRSESEALRIAENYFGDVARARGANPQKTRLTLVSPTQISKAIGRNSQQNTRASSSDLGLYIFNDESNQRFVIVSGDERQYETLGSSENGVFDPDKIPCGLQTFLELYANEYGYLQTIAIEDTKTRTVSQVNRAYSSTSPLVKTKWDQDSPYNDQCPYASGGRCITGCVATTMAQILNYHQYPERGEGVVKRIPGQNRLSQESLDLSAKAFDWNSLKNAEKVTSYSSSSAKSAVAYLMKACGYAINMNYGTSRQGSSASSGNIPDVFVNNFGYDRNATFVSRSSYTTSKWESLIQEELSNKRPIAYRGQGSHGGHSFILCGYRSSDGKYYFNWGWSGSQDGYYALSSLTPGSYSFTNGQSMAIRLQPSANVDVEKPVIYIDYDNNVATINCTTPDVKLYYSFTPQDQSSESSYSRYYGSKLSITKNGTYRAYAELKGKKTYAASQKVSLFKVDKPEFYPDGNKLTIKCPTATTIYYTKDGKTPTTSSTKYTSAITCTNGITVKAIGVKANYTTSNTAIYDYKENIKTVYNFTNTAGQISKQINNASKLEVISLTVSGQLNGTDIKFIREMCEKGKLSRIDIKNASIVSGGDTYYADYTTDNVIGKGMFRDLENLSSIELPAKIVEIGDWAFQGCTSLKQLEIPLTCKKIGVWAFRNTSINLLTIPQNVTEIEWGIIQGCKSLTSLSVDKNNKYYDSRDDCNAIIKTESNEIVAGCIRTVIPSSVKDIEMHAFCSSPKVLNIPGNIEHIWNWAFQDNTGLEEVTIDEGPRYISTGAFSGCTSLRSVTIPASVYKIVETTFEDCSSLRLLTTYAETPLEIEESVFAGSNYKSATLRVPYGCKSKYQNSAVWKDFKTIEEMPIVVNSIAEVKALNDDQYATLNLDQAQVTYAYTNVIDYVYLRDKTAAGYLFATDAITKLNIKVGDVISGKIPVRLSSTGGIQFLPYSFEPRYFSVLGNKPVVPKVISPDEVSKEENDADLIAVENVTMNGGVDYLYYNTSSEDYIWVSPISGLEPEEYEQILEATRDIDFAGKKFSLVGIPWRQSSLHLTQAVKDVTPSAVTSPRVDDHEDDNIFDLQGRKVSGVLKSGIYIKNGKKVYIK